MIITCKACNTSFNLDDKMLKPAGSKVRCSVCANVFTAFPQQAPTPEAAADVPEPEQAPQTEAASESDLAAAAAIPPVEQDTSAAADAADVQPPETNVLEEDNDALLEEGTDLDFALEDEPEEDLSDVRLKMRSAVFWMKTCLISSPNRNRMMGEVQRTSPAWMMMISAWIFLQRM
jgi:pilus assembly protein FimV